MKVQNHIGLAWTPIMLEARNADMGVLICSSQPVRPTWGWTRIPQVAKAIRERSQPRSEMSPSNVVHSSTASRLGRCAGKPIKVCCQAAKTSRVAAAKANPTFTNHRESPRRDKTAKVCSLQVAARSLPFPRNCSQRMVASPPTPLGEPCTGTQPGQCLCCKTQVWPAGLTGVWPLAPGNPDPRSQNDAVTKSLGSRSATL